ncbi:MAG TPA: hypothetical protein VF989_06800 [Polyangiaceae bacterium]
MAETPIDDVGAALAVLAFPTITRWNRLEGRPRAKDFDRALKAEVRDALWMLSKQWQLGELRGEDAGHAVFAKIKLDTTRLDRYRAADGPVEPYRDEIPLETRVEAKPIDLAWDGRNMRLSLRAMLGRQWRKMLDAAALGTFGDQYRALYRIELPPRDGGGDHVYARRADWQQALALSRRAIDGGALYRHLTENMAHRASDGVDAGASAGALDTLGDRFVEWFRSLYFQPASAESDAWMEERLEYRFACAAPHAAGDRVLGAEEYYHGRLDWYSFDADPSARLVLDEPGGAAPETPAVSFIPAPVGFEGMPDRRFWALEDRKTNFGQLTPSTTDLGQLLLLEFALVYSGDWFVLPVPLAVGSLAKVAGLVVTNTFGERFWITSANQGRDEDWRRFSMFTLSVRGDRDVPSDTSLFLPPALAKVQEAPPEEEAHLVRDEMANMVWGVQTVIPTVIGPGTAGKEFADAVATFHRDDATATAAEYQAPIYYHAQSSVLEHWVPFVPVRASASTRDVRLQRGRMLRFNDPSSDEPVTISPRITLLRPGLDQSPKLPYFLDEREVPREGIKVSQSFQRARWKNGRTFVWLGAAKQVGRGERTSGLAFDEIRNADPEEQP